MLKRTPFKRNNRTRIKKVSDSGKLKKVARKVLMERMIKMFDEVWNERKHISEVSGKWLGDEAKTTFFHHIYPKSTHSELTLFKDNIILLTFEEHTLVENDKYAFEEVNIRREQLKLKYDL